MSRKKIKYDSVIKPNLDNIRSMARQGATDARISDYLGISYATFARFKSENAKLVQVLAEGRRELMDDTAGALFRRAVGYTEKVKVRREKYDPDDNLLEVVVEQTEKQIPPDITAIRMVYTIYDKETTHFDRELKLLEEKRKTIGFERDTGVRVPSALKAEAEWLGAVKKEEKAETTYGKTKPAERIDTPDGVKAVDPTAGEAADGD